MTPAETQFNCTHAPYYQAGCLGCEVRYMKMLRSADKRLSRQKQDSFLAGLPRQRKAQVIELLKAEAQCKSTA